MPTHVLCIRRLARILAGAALIAAAAAPAASAHVSRYSYDPAHPAGSLRLLRDYQGLVYTAVGPCAGAYRIVGSADCTHGPDPEPTSAPRPKPERSSRAAAGV